MRWLRETVDSFTYEMSYDNAYDMLISKLADVGVKIEDENKGKGEIKATILAKVVDMVIWRCWSDRIIFALRSVDERKTRVDVYAIPNLFRIKARKGERVEDLGRLLSWLK